jgi:hypothetical protein
VLARKDNGYLALYSQMPMRWTANGVFQGEGMIADGRRNIWICQLGRAAVEGSFSAWVERITAAPLAFADLAVTYAAPGVGEIRFSWDGPFSVDGTPIPLDNYKRFDNPYCQAESGSGRYNITHGDERLEIEF